MNSYLRVKNARTVAVKSVKTSKVAKRNFAQLPDKMDFKSLAEHAPVAPTKQVKPEDLNWDVFVPKSGRKYFIVTLSL
jgi:hypothetical protein